MIKIPLPDLKIKIKAVVRKKDGTVSYPSK